MAPRRNFSSPHRGTFRTCGASMGLVTEDPLRRPVRRTRSHAGGFRALMGATAVAATVGGAALFVNHRGGGPHRTSIVITASPTSPAATSPAPAVPAATLVPWVDAPATVPATTTTTTTTLAANAACTPRELRPGVALSGAAGGSLYVRVPLANAGPGACRLPASPSISAVDASGRRVTLYEATRNAPGAPSALAAGGRTYLAIATSDSCGAGGTAVPGRPYRDLEAVLPTGTLPLPVPPVDVCAGLSAWFDASFGAGATPPPAVPGSVGSLSVAIPGLLPAGGAPVTVKAGSTLHYTVMLSNPTAAAVVLDPCPVYQEGIYPAAGQPAQETFSLNCSALTAIPARGQVGYEMVIETPAGAGVAKLWWRIAPDGPVTATTVSLVP